MDCFSSWHCQSSVDQSLGWGVIYYTVSTPQPGSSENVNCFQLGMFHHTDCRSQRMLQYVLTAAFLVFQPFNISETDQITQDCAQSVQCGLMLNILSILLTKIYMLSITVVSCGWNWDNIIWSLLLESCWWWLELLLLTLSMFSMRNLVHSGCRRIEKRNLMVELSWCVESDHHWLVFSFWPETLVLLGRLSMVSTAAPGNAETTYGNRFLSQTCTTPCSRLESNHQLTQSGKWSSSSKNKYSFEFNRQKQNVVIM